MSVYSQSTDTIDIKPIVVKSLYFTKNIKKIDSTIIILNKASSISELLQNFTALSIKNSGANGLSTISFRGTSAAHTQIFWNNIPLNNPLVGQADLSLIPVYITDKIIIQSGIETLQNTSGALGGAIFLKSLYSKKNTINLFYNTNTLNNNVFSSNFSFHKKKLFFKNGVYFSYGKNNYTFLNTALAFSPLDTLSNANFRNISYIQQINYKFSKATSISSYTWYNIYNEQLPPLMSYEGLNRNENQKGRNLKTGITLETKNNKYKFHNNFSFVHSYSNYYLADSIISKPINTIFEKSNTFTTENSFYNFSKFSKLFNTDKLVVSNRIQYNIVQNFDSAQYAMNGYSTKYFKNSLNAVINANISKKLRSTFAIVSVADSRDIYFPSFYLSIYNKNNLFWKINIGRNIHLPSINDLFWKPGGNPDLKPETAYSSDLTTGYYHKTDKLELSLKNTFFVSKISDWILWKPTEYYYWTPVNIKSVLSAGFEIFTELKISARIMQKILGNYSFTNSINLESEIPNDNSIGKQLIYIPKHTANITYFAQYKSISLSANIKYTGKRYTSTSNYENFTLKPYTIANTSISYKKNFTEHYQIILSAEINNVFNTNYQSVLYRAMPRRNYSVSLILNIK